MIHITKKTILDKALTESFSPKMPFRVAMGWLFSSKILKAMVRSGVRHRRLRLSGLRDSGYSSLPGD